MMLASPVSPLFASLEIFSLWIGLQLVVVVVGTKEMVPADSFADAGPAIERTAMAPALTASRRRLRKADWWYDTYGSWVRRCCRVLRPARTVVYCPVPSPLDGGPR